MSIAGGKTHTSSDFEKELAELRRMILELGAKVELMTAKGMESLFKRDSSLAERVMSWDDEADALNAGINDLCLRMMALRQPTAGDLRLILAGVKVASSLERIGDLAVNITERVLELNEEAPLKPYVELPRMSEATRLMLRESLDSFVKEDADLAIKVVRSDDEVDTMNQQLLRELLTYMMEDVRNIGRCQRLIFVSKYLERIADHASGVAKTVYFMIRGGFPPKRAWKKQLPPKRLA